MNVRYTRQTYYGATHIRPLGPQSHAATALDPYKETRIRTVLSLTYNAHRPDLLGKPCPLCKQGDYCAAHLLLACENLNARQLINSRHDKMLMLVFVHLQLHSQYAGSLMLSNARTYPTTRTNPKVHQSFVSRHRAGRGDGIPDIMIFPDVPSA